ncbi:unnamed protein product [Urochloa humidicola]
MASPKIPVVDILDDDDEDLSAAFFASPPSSRKRSHGSASSTSSADFLDAFSPSPPLHKRLQLAAGLPIALDDTPSPPKRRVSTSSATKQPVLVVDDDDPSAADDVVNETPDSVLGRVGFSETPETGVPSPSTPGTVVPETPGFGSLHSVGPSAARGLSSATPGTVVPETPGFGSLHSVGPSSARGLSSAAPAPKFSGVSSLISLDSDDEMDDNTMHRGASINLPSNIANSHPEAKKQPKEDVAQHIEATEKKQPEKKRLAKGEKAKLMEERKQKQQEDKLHKQVMKDELAKKKKKEKEIQQWESGKFALERITVEIDKSVAESGFGGCLLSSLSEKGFSYKLTENSIEGSILWKMDVPDDIAQALSSQSDDRDMKQVPYISFVLQAKEFCDLITNGKFFPHVLEVRKKYPRFTICYITNKLMSHINKQEQSQYKNNSTTWQRPPVEEVLCKLATHYTNVHSRQCIDEAEVAEHLVGLTTNLAKCKFRKPLTWLSVHANGAIISKGFVDKNLAKKDTWLKALIAIPDIQPRYAMAIRKKYPCMRSLLNEYMDPRKTVLEKELLLSDLKWEDRLGEEAKRLGNKCSRRVYRMFMAQNGDLDAEDL